MQHVWTHSRRSLSSPSVTWCQNMHNLSVVYTGHSTRADCVAQQKQNRGGRQPLGTEIITIYQNSLKEVLACRTFFRWLRDKKWSKNYKEQGLSLQMLHSIYYTYLYLANHLMFLLPCGFSYAICFLLSLLISSPVVRMFLAWSLQYDGTMWCEGWCVIRWGRRDDINKEDQ